MIQLKAINLTDSYADKIAVKFGNMPIALHKKVKLFQIAIALL
jgi:hypothetical protein